MGHAIPFPKQPPAGLNARAIALRYHRSLSPEIFEDGLWQPTEVVAGIQTSC